MIDGMRQFLRREDGAIELFVALTLVVILGFTALVVDIGNAKQTRRNFQTAADSGSLAGAQQMLPPVTGTEVTSAQTFAEEYAFDSMGQSRPAFTTPTACPGAPYPAKPTVDSVCFHSSGGAYVWVTTPYPFTTAYGAVLDPSSVINVRVCQQLNTSFARVLKINTTMVCNSGTSVAPTQTGNCVLCVMNTAANTCSFKLGGNADLTVTGVPPGPILVNNPNPNAVCGNGTTDVQSPGGFTYVGCHSSGQSCISGSGGVSWTNPPTPGPAAQDPLRNVVPPQVTTAGNCTTSGSTQTCTPGIYSTLTPLHNGTTILQTGVYVIKSGIAKMGPGDTLLSGPGGVMLYFTCSGYSSSNTAPCSGDGAGFASNSNGGFVGTPTQPFSAMTSGPYSGLLIFADRGNTANILDNTGNTAYNLKGTVYGLNATVNLGGNSGATMDSRFIIGNVDLQGTPNINEIYSDQFQGLPTTLVPLSLVG